MREQVQQSSAVSRLPEHPAGGDGGELTAAQKAAIPAIARSWVGTPFHHGAAIKGVGVDCARLLIEILAEAGVWESWCPDEYAPDWFLHSGRERYVEGLRPLAESVPPPWEIGDVLTYTYGRRVSHAAIYIGNGLIVHAQSGMSVAIMTTETEPLRSRFAGGWRMRQCRPQ